MAKASRLAEYRKHLSVVHYRKSSAQLKEEQEVAILASAPLMKETDAKRWQDREREIAKRDAAHKAEVERSFEVLRGRLSVEACLEEADLLVQCAKALASGKDVQMVEPVADLVWLDSEHVTDADVEKAAEYEGEVLAVVAEIHRRIERNSESTREAVARIGGDEALSKKLSKLEAQRKKALLAGDDLTKLNAEIMALRDEIEENKLAVGIAEQDVETLRVHAEALAEVLEQVNEIAAQVSAKAAALYSHSKVAELNRKTSELAALAQDVATVKARAVRQEGFTHKTLCHAASCEVSELILPMWRGHRVVPDFTGGTTQDKARLVVKVRFK